MSFKTEPGPWNTFSNMPAMPTSNLPSTAELSPEDDWTKVKDPKEKKRIQNRVAQRTYRHRMKARLGELQARLDSHEGRRSTSASTNTNSSGSISAATHSSSTPDTSDSSVPPPSSGSFTTTATTGGLPMVTGPHDSPSPLSSDKPPLSAQLTMGMQATNLYDHPVDDSDPSLFPQSGATRILQTPPQSIPSPQPNGMLSPPGQSGSEQPKVSQDFMLDCLRFQTQLLNRLNNLQPDTTYPAAYAQADNVQGMLETMGQADGVHSLTAFTPAHTEGMDFTFEGAAEGWKNEPYITKVRQMSSADSINFPPPTMTAADATVPPGSGHIAPAMINTSAALAAGSGHQQQTAAPPIVPLANATLDQRFEGVMQQVEAAGFESFDDLVSAYYNGSFTDPSPMANEQRLSRNRRLPNVIADISKAADGWSAWERRGYHEEILKTSEAMVLNEAVEGHNSLGGILSPLFDAQSGINTNPAPESVLSVKKSMQNAFPDSWALALALASDNRASWQRDQSNTALATMLLLKFSGTIPPEQLLSLVGSCLR